jgi:hypothetical protein
MGERKNGLEEQSVDFHCSRGWSMGPPKGAFWENLDRLALWRPKKTTGFERFPEEKRRIYAQS